MSAYAVQQILLKDDALAKRAGREGADALALEVAVLAAALFETLRDDFVKYLDAASGDHNWVNVPMLEAYQAARQNLAPTAEWAQLPEETQRSIITTGLAAVIEECVIAFAQDNATRPAGNGWTLVTAVGIDDQDTEVLDAVFCLTQAPGPFLQAVGLRVLPEVDQKAIDRMLTALNDDTITVVDLKKSVRAGLASYLPEVP
jgi:hypothetical protein